MLLLTRAVTAVAVLLAVLGSGVGAASAHTALAASEPSEGQVLTVAPQRIALTFTEDVRPESVQIAVRGPGGTSVGSGSAEVTGALVHQPVTVTGSGSYVVAYRIVSADGHPVTGQLTFGYTAPGGVDGTPSAGTGTPDVSTQEDAPDAAAPAEVSEQATATAAGGVSGGLWWMLGGAVAVVAVLALLAVRRRGIGD